MADSRSSFARIAVMAFFVLLLIPMALAGCGLKGPPLPPLEAGSTLGPPSGLSYVKAGSRITLTWTHEGGTAEGYKVFMARKGKDDCEGCPFLFKPVGTVTQPRFDLLLDTKAKYYFRVQALGQNSLESDFSDTLLVDDLE